MDIDEDNEQNRKDFKSIKNTTLSWAAKFNFKKWKKLCASLTRMQERILEDCGCKYCEQTFANRTEKLGHKKYMGKQYEITFSHSVNLHINTKKNYMENSTAKVTKQVPVPCSEKSITPPCSDCQALQYKCTECCHQGEKGNDFINQIKKNIKPFKVKLRLDHRFPPRGRNPKIYFPQKYFWGWCYQTHRRYSYRNMEGFQYRIV